MRPVLGSRVTMGPLPRRRQRFAPALCLTAQVLRQMVTQSRSAGLLVTRAAEEGGSTGVLRGPGDRLSDREWLGLHIGVYAIGVWNLLVLDLARTPGRWWFSLPVAVWAGLVASHAAWVLVRARSRAVTDAFLPRREPPGLLVRRWGDAR